MLNTPNARKKSQACSVGSDGLPVCPISMKHLGELNEKEVFTVCNDPTMYQVEALFHWLETQAKENKPLTYPHNKSVVSKADQERLLRLYKEWTGNQNASFFTRPLPVRSNSNVESNTNVESNSNVESDSNGTIPRNSHRSDIRRFDGLFENEEAQSFTDPRLLDKTYRGQPLVRFIQQECLEFVRIFTQNDRTVRRQYMQERNLDMRGLERQVQQEIETDVIEEPVLRSLTCCIYNWYGSRRNEYDEVSVMFYVKLRNRWLFVSLQHGHTFADLHDHEQDAASQVDDVFGNAILWRFFKKDRVTLAELEQMEGGGSRVKYQGRSYKVRVGKRGGRYILVQGEKKYLRN